MFLRFIVSVNGKISFWPRFKVKVRARAWFMLGKGIFLGCKVIILAWVLVRTRARITISFRDTVGVPINISFSVSVCWVQPGWGLHVPE